MTLQEALNFTDDDLAANRAGRLSEMQDYRLRLRLRRSIGLAVGISLVLVLVATGFIFLSLSSEGGSVILLLTGIGVTLCSAAVMGVFARYWMRLNADIRAGEVISVQGRLERIVRPVTRRVTNTFVRVGDVEAFVSPETFKAFEHDRFYTLYRLPYTGALLAAEPDAPNDAGSTV